MCLFLVFLIIPLVSASLKVNVKAGQDVTLQCQAPKDVVITLLEWIRPDLNSEGYVFFYRDKHLYRNYQHQHFMDRVELRDPVMKNGDVSVVLKNVTINDTGTYECFISVSKTSRRRRAEPDYSKTIELVVEDSGQTSRSTDDGDVRRHAAVILPFVGVITAAFGIFMKCSTNKEPQQQEV